MKRKRRIGIVLLLLLLVLAAIGVGLHQREDRGPLYQGRPTADWVTLALKGDSNAVAAVEAIGAAAVPFLARMGLHDRCHTHPSLSYSSIDSFCDNHPWIGGLAVRIGVIQLENCVSKHEMAGWLLSLMRTNAAAAIPDVIDCLEHCPSAHYVNALDFLELLPDISGTNTAAIPYLTYRARLDDSLSLRAAAMAFYIDGETNLFVETCQSLAKRAPDELVGSQELFWFRDVDELNVHLVPLLKELGAYSWLDASAEECVPEEVTVRTNKATATEEAAGPRD